MGPRQPLRLYIAFLPQLHRNQGAVFSFPPKGGRTQLLLCPLLLELQIPQSRTAADAPAFASCWCCSTLGGIFLPFQVVSATRGLLSAAPSGLILHSQEGQHLLCPKQCPPRVDRAVLRDPPRQTSTGRISTPLPPSTQLLQPRTRFISKTGFLRDALVPSSVASSDHDRGHEVLPG